MIFEDEVIERSARLSCLYPHRDKLGNPGLDRITLFVTHKCNLFCKYCNGPHMNKGIEPKLRKEMLASDLTFEQYSKMLADWIKHGATHIHFTGGEATLNKELPYFIKLASENSILTTLTTNGTADFSTYKNLVNYGLHEIRISIDSTVEKEFDTIVKKKGACKTIKDNIRKLTRLRDQEDRDLFVILNTCIGSFNIENIKKSLKALHELRPDDIKFLVVAEEHDYINSKASRKTVDNLLKSVNDLGKEYPLLRKKIRALFRKDNMGLKDRTSKHLLEHCFIPWTERTLDSRGIYPCSIYLRYTGKPLTNAVSGFAQQQKAIDDFVENHNCKEDSICIDNCTNCCKQFNLSVNRRLRARSHMIKAQKEAKVIAERIKEDELNKVIKTYKEIFNTNTDNLNPFIIIKPEGIEHEEEIKQYLKEQRVKILKETTIENWAQFSLFMYSDKISKKKLKFRLAKNKAYEKIDISNKAMYLMLEKSVPEAKLFRIKQEFRDWFYGKKRILKYEDEEKILDMNCVHSPDLKDLPYQNKVVRYFLGI